jgi:hypothetical protein
MGYRIYDDAQFRRVRRVDVELRRATAQALDGRGKKEHRPFRYCFCVSHDTASRLWCCASETLQPSLPAPDQRPEEKCGHANAIIELPPLLCCTDRAGSASRPNLANDLSTVPAGRSILSIWSSYWRISLISAKGSIPSGLPRSSCGQQASYPGELWTAA